MCVTNDQRDAGTLDRLDDRVAILEGQRQRLFHDDVLAATRGHDRVCAMELMRRRDIDRLDRIAFAKRAHVFIGRAAEVAHEGFARRRLRIGRRNQTNILVRGGGLHHDSASHAEPDDAECDRLVSKRLFHFMGPSSFAAARAKLMSSTSSRVRDPSIKFWSLKKPQMARRLASSTSPLGSMSWEVMSR